MKPLLVFTAAALAEIAGCFSFWAWWRLDKSVLWLLPGMAALALFGWLLAQVDSAFAGRAYAAMAGSISPPRSSGCGLPRACGPIGSTWRVLRSRWSAPASFWRHRVRACGCARLVVCMSKNSTYSDS
jgi:hypothetical protein